MSSANRKFKFGTMPSKDLSFYRGDEKTWPEIAEMFRKPVRRKVTTAEYLALSPKDRAPSKNTGLFLGGDSANGHRGKDDLIDRSIVNLDLDSDCDHLWAEFLDTGKLSALDGYAYLVHSTRSHSAAQAKFRIYLPLAAPVSPAEYEPVARGIAELLDPSMKAVARESYTAAQGMYWPSVSSDQEYTFAAVEGDFFDPAPLLKKYPADDASKWPKKPKEQVSEYQPGRRMTHPEEKKAIAPIIAAVHRAFDPHTFIEEFLGDVYFPSGDRYSPHGATGAPSVRIYDDAFIQSDHGSDKAVGQHNTFDLGRIHLFGDLDDDFDTDGMSLVEWPSYKAMAQWALEHDAVRQHLAEIEDEIEDERNRELLNELDLLDDEPDADEPAASDDEDLIGGTPKEKKPATTEEVLRKVKRVIAKAQSLSDLESRVDTVRAWPLDRFRDLHRDLVAPDLQKKFAELTGEKITKAQARKMLAPTVDDLRKQAIGEDMPGWLKDWVYLSQDNKFMHLESKEMLPREGFNARFAVAAGEKYQRNTFGISLVQPCDIAWSIHEIPKPYSTRYLPGGAALFEEEGSLWANTYRAPIVESGGYKGSEGVKQLKRLLEDLFPERDHRCMVMDFLVHCVRFPEKKLKYALMVKGSENEGKTLLSDLVTQLLGGFNCSVINSDMLREKFNGWAHEKLFCTIEEIRIPGREAEEVLNKLKPIITNSTIPIRRMQKDVVRERNFCNLYLTTNDEDALRMEVDNTRYLVLFTRFRNNEEVKAWHAKLMDEEGGIYVRELWEHIHKRPAQFLEAFAKYKFSEFYDADGRAPMTIFKKIMAEDSKTEERSLLEDLLSSGDAPGVTSDVLVWGAFRGILDEKGLAPKLHGGGVGKFLGPLGFVQAQKFSQKVAKKVISRRVWTRNLALLEADRTLTSDGRALAEREFAKMDELDDAEDLKNLV